MRLRFKPLKDGELRGVDDHPRAETESGLDRRMAILEHFKWSTEIGYSVVRDLWRYPRLKKWFPGKTHLSRCAFSVNEGSFPNIHLKWWPFFHFYIALSNRLRVWCSGGIGRL